MEFTNGNLYRNNNGDLFAILEECRNRKSAFENSERAPEESQKQNSPGSKNDDDDAASDGLSTIMNSYLTTETNNQGMGPTDNSLSTKNQGDLYAILEEARKIGHFEKKESKKNIFYPRTKTDDDDDDHHDNASDHLSYILKRHSTAQSKKQRVSSIERSGSGFDVVQAADNRINLAFAICKKQDEVRPLTDALLLLPHFGLKLDQEKSFKSLNKKLFSQNEAERQVTPPPPPSCTKKNDKPSKSDVLMLRIGSWQIISQNLEDVVAKCYFGKRQLVWEMLENGLKKKIQIPWEHILGMRATIEKNQSEVLEIELGKQPLFFKEKNPEPKKHTIWKSFTDFTDGQASTCRRHYLQFSQGALEKYYTVLQRVPQFLQMSQRPFPSLQSPHFASDILNCVGRDVSVNHERNSSQIISHQQFSNDFPNSSMDVSLDRNGNTFQTDSVLQPQYLKDCQNGMDIASVGYTEIGPEINSTQQQPDSENLHDFGSKFPLVCNANVPQFSNLQQPFYSNTPMSISPLQIGNQVEQTVYRRPLPDHCNVTDPGEAIEELLPDEFTNNTKAENASNTTRYDQLMNDFADSAQREVILEEPFCTTVTVTFQENPIIPCQDDNNLPLIDNNEGLENQTVQLPMNENKFPRYSNVAEGLNNVNEETTIISHQNYWPSIGGEQIGDGNICDQSNPWSVSLGLPQDNLVNMRFDPNETTKNFRGIQDSDKYHKA